MGLQGRAEDRSARPVARRVEIQPRAGGAGGVFHVAFSSDGGMIASANADRTVSLRDTQKRAVLRVIKGFPAPVTAVAFSADGTRLTTIAEDFASRAAQTIGVCDVATGRSLKVPDRAGLDLPSSQKSIDFFIGLR